jgi:2'-5' RNA ligase
MSGNLFAAVRLSDDERHALAAVLRDSGVAARMPGKRTRPANWHVTLRFVGDASEPVADQFARRIEDLVDLDPFRVAVSGIDGFPHTAKATVVYGAVDDPTGGFAELARLCDIAAIDVGFEPEGRPFVPHLTLSRTRPAVDVSRLPDMFDTPVRISVRAVTVLRTHSTRDGPVYEAVYEIPLG